MYGIDGVFKKIHNIYYYITELNNLATMEFIVMSYLNIFVETLVDENSRLTAFVSNTKTK